MAARFSYIESFEEIEAELAAATRDINEIVVHWTGGFLDSKETAESIADYHINVKGWSDIAYHYIIHRDGSIQRGRDINVVGGHAGGDRVVPYGRNKYTIGLSFVGGINLTGADASALGYNGDNIPGSYVGAESLTAAQFESFDYFVDCFLYIYPHGNLTGHYEIPNSSKVDPGFDVGDYQLRKFNSVRTVDPGIEGSISTSTLIERIQARIDSQSAQTN